MVMRFVRKTLCVAHNRIRGTRLSSRQRSRRHRQFGVPYRAAEVETLEDRLLLTLTVPTFDPVVEGQNPPTLTWSSDPEADSYRITIKNLETGKRIGQSNLLTNSFTPDEPLAAGSYRAWVRSEDASGHSGWSGALNFDVESQTSVQMVLGSSFPEIGTAAEKTQLLDAYRDLGATGLRFSINWRTTEQVPDQFSWKRYDRDIQWAHDNGLSLLLTIRSDAPNWATASGRTIDAQALPHFERFVTELVQRYGDKIDKLQFGNEWAVGNRFNGSGQTFTQISDSVHNILKQHSPDVEFVLGGLSTSALRALALREGTLPAPDGFLELPRIQAMLARTDYVLANAQYDLLDVHLYFNVDEWEAMVNALPPHRDVPLIVSEWGAVSEAEMDQQGGLDYDYWREQTQNAINTLAALDVAEAYSFKLQVLTAGVDRFKYSGMLWVDGTSVPLPDDIGGATSSQSSSFAAAPTSASAASTTNADDNQGTSDSEAAVESNLTGVELQPLASKDDDVDAEQVDELFAALVGPQLQGPSLLI